MPFLDDLNMKDVVASIRNVELRDVYSSHGDALDSDLGQLNLQKFEGWKEEKLASLVEVAFKNFPNQDKKKKTMHWQKTKTASFSSSSTMPKGLEKEEMKVILLQLCL